jgi:hypothetical protein
MVSKLVKYSRAQWIKDGMKFGIVIAHADTPKQFMTKIAQSKDQFVFLCDQYNIDPDTLIDAHRRRGVLARQRSAKAIIRRLGADPRSEDLEKFMETASVLEKVAFLGSIRQGMGWLATFGLGRLLKWGAGIGLVAALIYYLGKAGFLGKPATVDPKMIEAADKAGIPNPEKVMPYAANLKNQNNLDALKKLHAVMCKKSGRCNNDGSIEKVMNVLRRNDGTISPWAVAGAAAGSAGIAGQIVGGIAETVKNIKK